MLETDFNTLPQSYLRIGLRLLKKQRWDKNRFPFSNTSQIFDSTNVFEISNKPGGFWMEMEMISGRIELSAIATRPVDIN